MKQSRAMSLIEAVANVVVGYVLAIATQIVVFPWFGISAGMGEHLAIGLAFVVLCRARHNATYAERMIMRSCLGMHAASS
jgi:hypothetical protein